jgi:hypothetical protein
MKRYGRSTFLAWDFIVGFGAFDLVCVVAGTQASVRQSGVTVLFAEMALGAALLAVVLGALAILVTFFDEHYRQVLAAADNGMRGAMLPYQTVATVAGLATLTSLGTAVIWPALPWWAQTALWGVATWFVVWALVGTVQIVNITAFHGDQRGRLLEAISQARGILEHRKRSA